MENPDGRLTELEWVDRVSAFIVKAGLDMLLDSDEWSDMEADIQNDLDPATFDAATEALYRGETEREEQLADKLNDLSTAVWNKAIRRACEEVTGSTHAVSLC